MIMRFLIIFMLSISISGCVSSKKEMTPLELRSMQTRDYKDSYNKVFAATIAVFQDLGYSITNADKDTGLITGESASEDKTNFWTILGGINLNVQTRGTAFVERRKGKTSIRLNFVEKRLASGLYGQTTRGDIPIKEPKIYEAAHEKIANAIFVRR